MVNNNTKGWGAKLLSLFSFRNKFDWEYFNKITNDLGKYNYLRNNRTKLGSREYRETMTRVYSKIVANCPPDCRIEHHPDDGIIYKKVKDIAEQVVADARITQFQRNAIRLAQMGNYGKTSDSHPAASVNLRMMHVIRQGADPSFENKKHVCNQIENYFNKVKLGQQPIDEKYIHVKLEGGENVVINVQEDFDIGELKAFVFKSEQDYSSYRRRREDEIENKNKMATIEEMDLGAILYVNDKEATLTPLIDKLEPSGFRYGMIINRLQKSLPETENFKSEIKAMFPFVKNEDIKTNGKIEEYFPLELHHGYMNRFASKWFFIKNASSDPIMVYLADQEYDDKKFVSIKPGGVISLLYGNMLNCKKYNTITRVADNHEYMSQYKLKSHPEVKRDNNDKSY